MTAIYLLEPEQPGAAWAPFAGASTLAELRAGGWTIAERWARAFNLKAAKGTIAASMKGPRPLGALPVVAASTVRGPAWLADATFCPRLPMRASGSLPTPSAGSSRTSRIPRSAPCPAS